MKISKCITALLCPFVLLFFMVGPIYFFSYIHLPLYSEVILTSNIYKHDVNSPVWLFHESPLHIATRRGQKGLVAELIKYGADPNQPSREYGHRPLHTASTQCSADVVNVLIEGGAKVSLSSCRVTASVENSTVSQLESHLYFTPLHLVAAKAPETCNFTALMSAMFSDREDTVEPSIPNIHEVDDLGNTFMHQAAMHCNLPFLTWLLQDISTNEYHSLSSFFDVATTTTTTSSSKSTWLTDFKEAALAKLWQKNKFGWLPIHYASICEVSAQKTLTPTKKKSKQFTLLQYYKTQMTGTLKNILQGGEISPPPAYSNLSGKGPYLAIISHYERILTRF